jgi:hypothetical protein
MTPEDDLTAALRRFLHVEGERNASDHDDHVDVTAIQSALAAGAQLVRPGDLLGPGEAAVLLDVHPTTVSRWSREGYMPTPLQEEVRGPAWNRPTLLAFKRDHAAKADRSGRRPLGSASAR